MPCSERQKEIKRRHKRREQVTKLKARALKPSASASEKEEIARKLRLMTPGASVLIKDWKLIEPK